MEKNAKIYIAGHEGMVGSILFKELKRRGYNNLITIPFKRLDLRNQRDTYNVVKEEQPEYIFLISGKVGGIRANIKFPAEFLYDNLMIHTKGEFGGIGIPRSKQPAAPGYEEEQLRGEDHP